MLPAVAELHQGAKLGLFDLVYFTLVNLLKLCCIETELG